MHNSIEKLAYKISEAVQGDCLVDGTDKINIFHRKISAHTSSDIAFSNGLIASGIRASALISEEKSSVNFNSFRTSLRQHLPLVLNINSLSGSIRAFEAFNCFILVATSPKEHINLNILAHRIAELSLVPGLVIANYSNANDSINLPSDDLLRKYLGNPDDQIESPTPAQKLIFGNTRRRVPNWFSLDVPVMLGAHKEGNAKVFEAIASEKYFSDHLQDIITRSIAEFKAVFSEDIGLVTSQNKQGKEAIIANSSMVFETFQSSEQKKLPQLVKLNQIKPFPEQEVKDLLTKAKAITLLENAELGGSSSYLAQQFKLSINSLSFYFGRLGNNLSLNSLNELIQHMNLDKSPREYYVELQFTKSKSEYPKHEILLQDIDAHYPALQNISVGHSISSVKDGPKNVKIPRSIRQHQDKGPNYSKLSGFYDNTAFFYQQNELSEIVADPFSAMPITPAGSAGFFDVSTKREVVPHFRPIKCTGCGDCFVQCPHAALPPIVIGIEQLMKTGMDLATAKGQKILKLTPMLKNLAKVAGKYLDKQTENLADFLPEAFNDLCKQMKLDDEALETAKIEFELVLSELKSLPTSITQTFFIEPNDIEKGSGEIFSLAFNPDTCTGCGICSEACPEEAINMVEKDEELIKEAEEAFSLWESLPSIAVTTQDRLKETNDYNKLASILLPKKNYNSLTGGNIEETNNAYKTLVHLVTATVNDLILPRRLELLNHLEELITSISENVHQSLSNALPKDNLDKLAITLKDTRSEKTSFHEIVDRLEELGQNKMVDTRVLQRKTDLVDALKELKWVIKKGPTGVGRATFGVYLTGSNQISWAQAYPYNNLNVPSVVQWQNSAPDQVLGLINGHIRHQIDNIKLIRRAGMEASGKYDPAAHDLEIASLDWNKLTVEERSSIPPIIVIGDRDDVNSSGWQNLNKLLSSEFPVKIILLDHIAPPTNDSVQGLTQSYSGLINAITLKNAFVYQGTMANPDHLANGLTKGMAILGPALLNLYAFKDSAHNADANFSVAYANLAVNSRTFPLIYFNPDKEHGFLNGSIDLDANPVVSDNWLSEEISLPNGETLGYEVTWADWAYTQENWITEFKKISHDNSNILLSEYVKLDSKKRANKIPVILRSAANELVYYSVSRKVVQMTETVLDNWNTLQELAGLITEFPVKLSEQVKKELNSKYDQDVLELKKEYDKKMHEQEQEFMNKMRIQIKERLVQLSKMAKN